MLSPRSQFQLFNRGYDETAVLVPGWGTDYRIFLSLELGVNYLFPVELSLDWFADDLAQALDEMACSQVSLLGWSMGGFLAAQFALAYPERVSALTLVSVRRRYDKEALAGAAERINKNKRAFMRTFYLSCFSRADEQGAGWFRENLLDYYVEMVPAQELLTGISYLARVSIDALPRDFPTHIIHGADDVIAPLSEAQVLARFNHARCTVLPGLGHIPFLNEAFLSAVSRE